jgi:hypothetical protein
MVEWMSVTIMMIIMIMIILMMIKMDPRKDPDNDNDNDDAKRREKKKRRRKARKEGRREAESPPRACKQAGGESQTATGEDAWLQIAVGDYNCRQRRGSRIKEKELTSLLMYV